MPDKWAQYAAPDAPKQGGDKWAQFAQTPPPANTPAPTAPITDTVSAPPTMGEKLKAMVLHPFNALESASQTVSRPSNATMPEMFATDLHNVGAGMTSVFRHPLDTLAGMVVSPVKAVTDPQGTFQQLNQGGPVAGASMLGQGIATAALGKFAPKPLESIGGKMQDSGAGVINKTVGSLKNDFKRGANPGRAYLDAGGGPAMSMDSLADKSAALKDQTGAKLQSIYDQATQDGIKIPVNKVTSALRAPIQEARSVVTGPGGSGDVAPIRQFGASFSPPIQKAVADGGFSPNDLWAVKKNVAKNTSWTDPTQIGMKSLRQETTGSLGGTLTDFVPEAKPLNSQYQGLTNLANRAESRALTGSSPLTHIAAKTALGASGAMLGSTHSPIAGALTGAGAMALDSVPVKTTVGTGLYHGGKGMVAIGKGIRSLYR